MKIAFISCEYPPDTAWGGIATYVQQAAHMLGDRGHHVEVFAGSPTRSGVDIEGSVTVHRVPIGDPENFPIRAGEQFAARHALVRFDVLEGPDYHADAREAVRLVPSIPLVLKLHTPTYLATEASASMSDSVVRKGPRDCDIERIHAGEADEVVAPSRAIGDRVSRDWGIDPTQLSHVSYPYRPSERLLSIPADTHTRVVTFLGRLEARKGVLHLARAVPLIVARHPDVKIRFVGRSLASPDPRLDMRAYLERTLRPYSRSVEFCDPVPVDDIPLVMASTDICVCPSIWENFALVCMEAMAAARGVIASNAGGMAEMLNDGEAGRTISPRDPEGLAAGVIELLDDPALRIRLGSAARARVLHEYSAHRIGPLQEASYSRAIRRRGSVGPRLPDSASQLKFDRLWRKELLDASRELCAAVPDGARFILVDDNMWGTDVVAGRYAISFLGDGEQYWGNPPDDKSAIERLERLRNTGASFLVLAWPAFWWLEQYRGLARHLHERFQCTFESDRLVVVDLRS